MSNSVRCSYCRQRHMPRYLCDSAKAFLDAVQARGDSFTMPTLELSDPLYPPDLGQAPGDVLMRQFVVQAAMLEAGDVAHPGLVFTGRDARTEPLPNWTYLGTDDQLRAAAKLVADMAELAIRRADEANAAAGRDR